MEERWISRSSRGLAVAGVFAVFASAAYAQDTSAPQVDAQRVCMVEGQFAQVDATITSADEKVVARLFFRSNLSAESYFVKMTPVETPAPAAGTRRVRAILPKPILSASPITYHAEVLSASGTSRSPDIVVKVVRKKEDCDVDVPAIILPKRGTVTVYNESGASAGASASAGVLGHTAGLGAFAATTAGVITAFAIAGGTAAVIPSQADNPESACR